MAVPGQPGESKIEIAPFPLSLAAHLKLQAPPFQDPAQAFGQLNYIHGYLSKHFTPRSILVEHHYIDRDFMEDYSVFYSRNFAGYENHCRRVHFFQIGREELEQKLAELVQIGYQGRQEDYLQACREFSRQSYLGFTVLKPLMGCPVGRTVLRALDGRTADGCIRHLSCTREYLAHVCGVELCVRGLAFQQQDVGVSACATTALWSSFQKLRVFEEIGKATPAQITLMAASHTLPFGRSMPSEGLSVDQMCQAVHAVGLSPNLYRADTFNWTRQLIFTAAKSAFAPILVIHRDTSYHAVTVAGMKLRSGHVPTLIEGAIDDMASDLVAVYLHDDRKGPYLRAELEDSAGKMELILKKNSHIESESERWKLDYILIPTHSKIRLTFGGLRDIAISILKDIYAIYKGFGNQLDVSRDAGSLEYWIQLGHSYVRDLFVASKQLTPDKIHEFCLKISMPRYIGIIRIQSSFFGSIDILIDTTCTKRNPYFIGIIVKGSGASHASQLSAMLKIICRCPMLRC